MCKIDKMTRSDLLEMRGEIDATLKEFKKINIRSKWKRCGKKGCFCKDGPLDGSWGNLHGPYVFAQFVDQGTGKYRSISLGAYFNQDFIDQVLGEPVLWNEYYKVPDSEYQTFKEEKKEKYGWYVHLDDAQFLAFFGVWKHEDKMDRDDVFFATEAAHDAYQNKLEVRARQLDLINSDWCREYGIGDEIGHIKLKELLAGKYYLA
jgi:hypothetical protein